MNDLPLKIHMDASSLTLDERELAARLQCAPAEVGEWLPARMKVLTAAARCSVCAHKIPVLLEPPDRCHLGPLTLSSRGLHQVLTGCNEALVFAATLGPEVDRLLSREALFSSAGQFITDALASALVEALCDAAEARLCAGRAHRPRFSPGYSDLSLAVQQELLTFLHADRTIGIHLTDSTLMIPTKSVTAIIGLLPGPSPD